MLKVISYGNERNTGMINLKKSLKKWGYDYKIIGIGEIWRGFRNKLEGYNKEIDNYEEDQVVCIIDCYDVLATGPPETLYYRFLAFKTPIVFGSESMVGVNGLILNNWWNHHSSLTRPKNQYLNSGCFIGRAKDIKHALRYALNSTFDDDQLALCAYTEAFPRRVYLDIKSSLFGNITGLDFRHYKTKEDRLLDTRSLRKPCFVHIPGKTGDLMIRMNHYGKKILGEKYVQTSLLETIPTAMKKLLKPNNRATLFKLINGLLVYIVTVIRDPALLLTIPIGVIAYFFQLQ